MDNEQKETLIEEFSAFLDSAGSIADLGRDKADEMDLSTLLRELVALKNEVKIEARQFKSALQDFNAVLDSVNNEKTHLTELLDNSREQIETTKLDTLKVLITQLLDVRDRIEAGLRTANSYQPRWYQLFGRKREKAVIRGLREGQLLTLKRLDQLLASYQVTSITVEQQTLDPSCMNAVDIDRIPDLENGIVTAEIRKGFHMRDEVLRYAEVRVNKVDY